jgi:hypothetical protein
VIGEIPVVVVTIMAVVIMNVAVVIILTAMAHGGIISKSALTGEVNRFITVVCVALNLALRMHIVVTVDIIMAIINMNVVVALLVLAIVIGPPTNKLAQVLVVAVDLPTTKTSIIHVMFVIATMTLDMLTIMSILAAFLVGASTAQGVANTNSAVDMTRIFQLMQILRLFAANAGIETVTTDRNYKGY